MRNLICIISSLLLVLVLLSGCSSSRYNTQKGAAIGAGLGAAYGQAIGRDTQSTLIGTALGGLTGAVMGNYEDQRYQEQRDYQRRAYSAPPPPPPPAYSAPYRGSGNWVNVPGQYIGNQYVQPHNVWVPQQNTGVVVER